MSNENINTLKNVLPLSKNSEYNNSTSTLNSNYSYEINSDDIPLLITSPKPTYDKNKIYNNEFSNYSRIYVVTHVYANSSLTEKCEIIKKSRSEKIKDSWNWLIDSRHPKRKLPPVALIILIMILSIFAIKGIRDPILYALVTISVAISSLLYLCKL